MPSSFPLDSRGCGNDVICLIPLVKASQRLGLLYFP